MALKEQPRKGNDAFRSEAKTFYFLLFVFEVAIIIIYAVWSDYITDDGTAATSLARYGFTRDVGIMVFFGFGFLLTFLRYVYFFSRGGNR